MKHLYFSHAFTGATPNYLARIEAILLACLPPGWALLPHFSENGRTYDPMTTAGQLFSVDIVRGVCAADAVVFESTLATTGGGFEAGVAVAIGKPALILAVNPIGSSALTYDAAQSTENPFGGTVLFSRYDEADQAADIVRMFLESLP